MMSFKLVTSARWFVASYSRDSSLPAHSQHVLLYAELFIDYGNVCKSELVLLIECASHYSQVVLGKGVQGGSIVVKI